MIISYRLGSEAPSKTKPKEFFDKWAKNPPPDLYEFGQVLQDMANKLEKQNAK